MEDKHLLDLLIFTLKLVEKQDREGEMHLKPVSRCCAGILRDFGYLLQIKESAESAKSLGETHFENPSNGI